MVSRELETNHDLVARLEEYDMSRTAIARPRLPRPFSSFHSLKTPTPNLLLIPHPYSTVQAIATLSPRKPLTLAANQPPIRHAESTIQVITSPRKSGLLATLGMGPNHRIQIEVDLLVAVNAIAQPNPCDGSYLSDLPESTLVAICYDNYVASNVNPRQKRAGINTDYRLKFKSLPENVMQPSVRQRRSIGVRLREQELRRRPD